MAGEGGVGGRSLSVPVVLHPHRDDDLVDKRVTESETCIQGPAWVAGFPWIRVFWRLAVVQTPMVETGDV